MPNKNQLLRSSDFVTIAQLIYIYGVSVANGGARYACPTAQGGGPLHSYS